MSPSIAGVKVTRDEHGDGHADGADGAHHSQEGDPGHVEPEQCDEDRHPGEDDGVPGGARREADGLAQAVAFLQLPAMAIDDEQRIVDADREAEHDAEHRGDRHHLDDARKRERREDADADADERAEDRQTGADKSAEHDDQDDRRDDEADQFTAAEDGRDARGDLRREVGHDAWDRLRAERILDGALGDGGHVELGLGEHDGGHRGTAVLRHESDAGRHLEQGRSLLELAALRIQLRLALIELRLLCCQAGCGLVERSGCLGLCARGIELRLTLVELGRRLFELRLPGGDLLVLGRPGGLGRERVHDLRDAVDVRGRADPGGDRGLLGVGERLAVLRPEDDRAIAAGCGGELGGEALGDLCGRRSGDREPVRQVPASDREGDPGESEDRDPGDDHDAASSAREPADPIEKCCHVVAPVRVDVTVRGRVEARQAKDGVEGFGGEGGGRSSAGAAAVDQVATASGRSKPARSRSKHSWSRRSRSTDVALPDPGNWKLVTMAEMAAAVTRCG